MDTSIQSMFSRIVLYLVGYGLRYLAAGFLTGAVLPTFGVLMVGYISVWGPEMPFLGVLSLLLPIDAQGNAEIDGDDIMRAFALLTLIVAALAEVVKAIPRLLQLSASSGHEAGMKSSRLRSLRVPLILITIVFATSALAFVIGGAAQVASRFAILGIIAFMYVIAMGSLTLYKVIDTMAEGILALVRPGSEVASI